MILTGLYQVIMFDLTIYTITYNRPSLLSRLYESIAKLEIEESRVEWVIVDNGSAQSTKDLVRSFCLTNGVSLSVYSIDCNVGFSRADNFFYENHIAGVYVVRIDDDDIALPNLVTAFENYRAEADIDGTICGMLFNMGEIDGAGVIGPEFSTDKLKTTNYNLYYRNRVTGDKVHFYKSVIRKRFMHRVFPGELLTPVSIVYCQMDRDFLHLCCNATVALREYTVSGITLSKAHLHNTVGNILGCQFLIEHNNATFSDKLMFIGKIARQILRSSYDVNFLLNSEHFGYGIKSIVLLLSPIKVTIDFFAQLDSVRKKLFMID